MMDAQRETEREGDGERGERKVETDRQADKRLYL